MTPREIGAVVKAASNRMLRKFEEQRLLNSEMANLVAFAFHDPAKIPKYEPLGKERVEQSTEADDAYVRAFFIGMARAKESQ